MFRLNKHRSQRLGERLEFKFYNFQAFKIPRGWDKLYVSVISVESGRTVAKSSKTTVYSGTCQWAETLSESISISQDSGSKDREEYLFRFVISMGSGKAGILGEIVLNLADYMDLSDSGPLTLPLNKCSYDTLLQVKIQCFNPKNKLRDGNSLRKTNSILESPSASSHDMDNKSDTSNTTIYGSIGSFSCSVTTNAAPSNRAANQDAVSLASGSHSSSDSTENSLGRTKPSPKHVNGSSDIGRQDSAGSHASATSSAGHDDASRSNPSSFNSRASGSSTPHQWQEAATQPVPLGPSSLSLSSSSSAKELLEAAEETIDELRDEAKMWERHAQKLKIDVERLKKDFSFKSKQQEEMGIELSAANNERDSLQREVDQLRLSLNKLKGSLEDKESFKAEGLLRSQRQLEDELKFLRESNSTLIMQLNKSQEANIELVAILEELEETVEKQRLELASLTQSISMPDNGDRMRNEKLADIEVGLAKEKVTVRSEKDLHKVEDDTHDKVFALNQGNSDLMQEIESLRSKVEELEMDCTELTEENLELICKLKESNKNIHGLSLPDGSSSYDTNQLKFQCRLEEELQTREIKEVINIEPLASSEQIPDFFKSKFFVEIPSLVHEMHKQLQLALIHESLNNGQNIVTENYNDIVSDYMVSSRTSAACHEELIEDRLTNIIKLSSSLQDKVVEWNAFFQNAGEKDPQIIKVDILDDHQNDALVEKLKLENEELEAAFLLKEREIDALEILMKELEDMVSNIKREKVQVEETLSVTQRENIITSKCLDDVRNEMTILSSNTDTHLSANKMLERKSTELEMGSSERDLRISELEEENLKMSEHLSSLEAQLGHMLNEKEANRFEIEDCKFHIMDLKSLLLQEQAYIEILKAEHMKGLQEVQNQLFESQKELEATKKSYSELQAIVERLTEECSLLQIQTDDLRGKKMEMCEQMSYFEAGSEDLQKKIAVHLNTFKALEEKLSSVQSDFALKEEALVSQLDNLLHESKKHDQKLSKANAMLKLINEEQMVEVDNLKQEILNLSTQTYTSHGDFEKTIADAQKEVSILRVDKKKLEKNLHEVQFKVNLYETELHSLTKESDSKVEGVLNLLNASKQSEEMLMADIERLQRMTESLKFSENTYMIMANEFELKLKASDYEKQQISEDASLLKLQLQKATQFQNEILNLQASLEETNFKREKLEGLLHSASEECEDLKVEKTALSDKISLLQKALHDGANDWRCKVASEETIVRLEADLAMREASYNQEVGVNSKYQQKIQILEEENGEIKRKAHVFEKELGQTNALAKVENNHEGTQVQRESTFESEIYSLQVQLTKALEENNAHQTQLNGYLSEKESTDQPNRISSLESELKEMRERYLYMSLQYAEVEAQREELVMQLKSTKKEKKWFS